jgi:hypothetical protein
MVGPFQFIPPFRRNTIQGELKLQSCEGANIFYATAIQVDANLEMGDYSQDSWWEVTPYTHQGKQEEDEVFVDGKSTIIQGVYRDVDESSFREDIPYVISVYVWVEIDETC